MDEQIIKDITAEIDNAFTPEGTAEIGMLTIKTANQTVEDAAMRQDTNPEMQVPEPSRYRRLIYRILENQKKSHRSGTIG